MLAVCKPCSAGENSPAGAGEWSKEATPLLYTGGTRRLQIRAPDPRKTAIIEGVRFYVAMDGRRLPGTEDKGVSTLAELAWSPDSRAFFVTESYGGAVGDWHVFVYIIEKARVRSIYVTEEVVRRFKRHYACYEPEEPNVGAIKWVTDSKQLLLVAEVPPHSSCPEMGKVRGYLVSVPAGAIIKEFTERQLRHRWTRYLGDRFRK